MAIAGGALYFFTQRQSAPESPTASAPVASPTSAPAQAPTTATSPTPSADTGPLPAPLSLNLQANHPNGSTLRLTQVTFNEDNIAVNLSVTNGYKSEIRLNQSDDFILTDNFGNQYNLAAPAQNEKITIAPSTTLKGQFVFIGRLAPNATSLSLTTNNKFGGNESYSVAPKFTLNIPVQGGTK